MSARREGKVETYLHRRVTGKGGTTRKWVSPGHAGVPDRIVVWPLGVIHFVETKTAYKDYSDKQRREAEKLIALHCEVFLLDSEAAVDIYINRKRHLWNSRRLKPTRSSSQKTSSPSSKSTSRSGGTSAP